MKKLNKKQMTKVSGGSYLVDSTISMEDIVRHRGSLVGKYDGVEGNTYIFEHIPTHIVGKLVKTYEAQASIYGDTKRTHDVLIKDVHLDWGSAEYNIGNTISLSGDTFDMFEYVD